MAHQKPNSDYMKMSNPIERLFFSIIDVFNPNLYWRKIKHKDIPRWVDRAYIKWEMRLSVRPYNVTKYFVGKNFIYKVKQGQGLQSEAPIIGWYRKKRRS